MVGADSWGAFVAPLFFGRISVRSRQRPRPLRKSGLRLRSLPMPDLVSGLNPEQHKAVTLPRESALILAGAGSGKTRVLTTRIAHLIQTGEVSPAGILAVTFTNKAAREMLTRLSAMLPINTRGMWVGTFHGLCNRLLRTHYRDAGLPQLFQILDSGDQQSLIKRLAKAQGLDEEKFPPRQLQNFINNCKEAGLRANAVEAGDEFTRRMVAVLRRLRRAVQPRGRGRFRRAAAAHLRAAREAPEPAAALPEPLPLHPGRRVPGHQQAAVQVDQDARRARTGACSRWGTTTSACSTGTPVTMADGSRKPDRGGRAWATRVLSCYAHGRLPCRPRWPTCTRSRARRDLVRDRACTTAACW